MFLANKISDVATTSTFMVVSVELHIMTHSCMRYLGLWRTCLERAK